MVFLPLKQSLTNLITITMATCMCWASYQGDLICFLQHPGKYSLSFAEEKPKSQRSNRSWSHDNSNFPPDSIWAWVYVSFFIHCSLWTIDVVWNWGWVFQSFRMVFLVVFDHIYAGRMEQSRLDDQMRILDSWNARWQQRQSWPIHHFPEQFSTLDWRELVYKYPSSFTTLRCLFYIVT